MPRISIIIPTLNRAVLLPQTLDSLQRQTFPDWEAIVVDDGSTDGTEMLMQQRVAADARIRYAPRSLERSGASVCRNLGTRLAHSDYLIFLDSDDYLAPTCLANRYACMEAHPELDFGVFQTLLFRDRPGDLRKIWNVPTARNDLDRFFSGDFPWTTTGPMWRRQALESIGGWDETLPSWQDLDLHVRALIQQFNYRWFGYPDNFWRVPHPGSIGCDQFSREHMRSHEDWLIRLRHQLMAKNLFTRERQWVIGGMYFWLMDHWAMKQCPLEAEALWKTGLELQLMSPSVYQQGRWIIWVSCFLHLPWIVRRMIRRLLREYYKLAWPPGLCWDMAPTWRQSLPANVEIPV
jgi:glycosyltransferase involved in cell wall biosynthesis